jgi:hypothetical protein
MMSNELDILIVGYGNERFSTDIRRAFRHWQVYSCASPHALYGRRFRRAYFTEGAMQHPAWNRVHATLNAAAIKLRGEVLPFETFAPEYDVQTFEDAMALRDLRRSRHPAV